MRPLDRENELRFSLGGSLPWLIVVILLVLFGSSVPWDAVVTQSPQHEAEAS